MITDIQYMDIVSEVYDLSDYKTKKKVLFCNEAQKSANIEHIAMKLYEHIKKNSDSIDFGTIPKSKGIVTNVENYQQIVDCINVIHDLVKEYHEDTRLVDSLLTALDNIQNRSRIFTKAFTLNIDFPIMMYNMTVMSIISATSLLIATSVEYIKNGHDSFSISFDKIRYKKSQNHVMFEYVQQFNRECANGNLDKAMDECIKKNVTTTSVKESFGMELTADEMILNEEISMGQIRGAWNNANKIGKIGVLIVAIPFIFGLLKTLFLFIRKAIYYFKYIKMKLSDWFEVQANFLQINAENLKYRDDEQGEDHQKKVYQRQMKWVERLKKLANDFALKDAKAKKDADNEDDDYSRKRKYEDDEDDDNDGGLF